MRVREYLLFRAKLKDVPVSKRRAAIDYVVRRCRLDEVEQRILGQLSKGYRQRVGLAEAMVHDPDILILDEPTAGLDPIQIREVRSLIRELGDRHTILLSTHIMSEVEAVCGRVLLIVGGRIRIDDTLDRLQTEQSFLLDVRGPADQVRRALETAPGVARVTSSRRDGDQTAFEVHAQRGADPREDLARRVIQNGWGLRALEVRRSSLEERFVQAVRDANVGDDSGNEAA
jgi:ABC-2 type transport system ATP-binding protein